MVMSREKIWDAAHGAVPWVSSPATAPISMDQVQPASIDLRLGHKAYGLKASVLPSATERIKDVMDARKEFEFGLDTKKTNVLKRGQIHVIELMEECALPRNAWMEFSPKSSTGRAGVWVRVLCNNQPHYDITPRGYRGPLFLEVFPIAFDILVREALSLVQGRIKNPDTKVLRERELSELHSQDGLLSCDGKNLADHDLRIVDDELYYHVDLGRPVVGLQAKQGVQIPLNLTASKEDENLHEPGDFWEPILSKRLRDKRLTLFPGEFYLLTTKEVVNIPGSVCAQMQASKLTTGDFQAHFAGFFDPGFNNHGVLEVQANRMPFELRDRSPICSMKFEWMTSKPQTLYGTGSNSHYPGVDGQYKPSLSKVFTEREKAWTLEYWSQFYRV